MMSLPAGFGPPTITITREDRVLVTDSDGCIRRSEDEGFFARDTRFVSGYELLLNGQRPLLLNSSAVRHFSARYEFANPPLLDSVGAIPREQVALRLDRTIAGGVHEDYDVVNYGRRPIALALEIRIDSDFADVFEVKDRRLVRRGTINSRWDRARRELRTTYENSTFRRELLVK